MVIVVHSEPHLATHRASICSQACCFNVLTWAACIFAPFFVAYHSNGAQNAIDVNINIGSLLSTPLRCTAAVSRWQLDNCQLRVIRLRIVIMRRSMVRGAFSSRHTEGSFQAPSGGRHRRGEWRQRFALEHRTLPESAVGLKAALRRHIGALSSTDGDITH